ncbi:MAG: hypothetical protein NC079_04210 [Clostridium sp.]|nr:hypothetical protein [Acetatifactor muris]MCM1526744.1 hypothetical protein [Bacteroides sp.]MCM1562796.1 hypothetical protein [Clostridium sp.]
MWEWLRNARLGWLDFTGAGKLAVLFLAALLYLVFATGQKGSRRRLVIYAAVMAALCICPVTAAVLMVYQTRFYDYQWIWSMVPMTAVAALGGTVFLTGQWKTGRGYRTWARNAAVTLCVAAILVLCGNMGQAQAEDTYINLDRERAEAVLEKAREVCPGEICLWAPREILEYARLGDGSITLLYGRNMWEESLNAYSYDTYSGELRELYEWMEQLEERGGESLVQRAFDLGADCIILPKDLGEGILSATSDITDVIELDEGYYLLKMR